MTFRRFISYGFIVVMTLPLALAAEESPPGDNPPVPDLLWKHSGTTRRGTLERMDLVPPRKPPESRPQELPRSEAKVSPNERTPLKFVVPVHPEHLKPRNPPIDSLKSLSRKTNEPLPQVEVIRNAQPGSSGSLTPEPTAVAVGSYVLYTANHSYSLSFDGGRTFADLNPATGPMAPPSGMEFCCDQTTVYNPGTQAVFFLQQYFHDGSTNVQRITVDQDADGFFECAYDIDPQSAGFPTNRWADYPDLAISNGYLYHSSNVFDTTDVNGLSVGAFVARYDVSQIAGCSPSLSFDAYVDTDFTGFRFTRGATDTMYFASHVSNHLLRIWTWPESADSPSPADRNVTPWTTGVRSCPDPTGGDSCQGVDNRLQTAFVRNGLVGFVWTPAQGGGYPYPFARIAQFFDDDLSLFIEEDLWDQDTAAVYPSMAVDSAGDLGGSYLLAGGIFATAGAVFTADDDGSGFFVGPPNVFIAQLGTLGVSERTGDYTMTRPYYPSFFSEQAQGWVATGFAFIPILYPVLTTIVLPRVTIFRRPDYVFTDGFESGDICAWSSTCP